VNIIRLFILLGLLIGSASALAEPVKPAPFTPAQQAQIQSIVHDYLINNPQVLMEMVQRIQQAQQGKVQQIIAENGQALFFTPTSPTVGNPKGDVTVVEFLDYQCPHCKHVDPFIEQLLSKDANVRVVFKQFPIFGETSEFAARAALAAQQQGKYLVLHKALIQAKGRFSDQQILDIAKAAGLDVAKLQTAMNSAVVTQEIKANKQMADTLNLPGTPAFIIVNTPTNPTVKPTRIFLIPGDTDLKTLEQRVADARKKAA
jgi:protein-disulfide isomerase